MESGSDVFGHVTQKPRAGFVHPGHGIRFLVGLKISPPVQRIPHTEALTGERRALRTAGRVVHQFPIPVTDALHKPVLVLKLLNYLAGPRA